MSYRYAFMHRVVGSVSKRLCKLDFGAVTLALLLETVGCSSGAAREGPEEVVREFLSRMSQVHGDPADAKLAYKLMWSKARTNLSERAKRASAAAGRQVAPEEMIAPSRFSMAFVPQKYQVSRQQGDLAEVIVSTEQPTSRSESVWCKLEDGQWRVVLRLPPVTPIHKRDVPVRSDRRPSDD